MRICRPGWGFLIMGCFTSFMILKKCHGDFTRRIGNFGKLFILNLRHLRLHGCGRINQIKIFRKFSSSFKFLNLPFPMHTAWEKKRGSENYRKSAQVLFSERWRSAVAYGCKREQNISKSSFESGISLDDRIIGKNLSRILLNRKIWRNSLPGYKKNIFCFYRLRIAKTALYC